MSVLALIIVLLFLAALYWLFNIKWGAKISPPFKFLINIVLIGTAVILVLVQFGIWDAVKGVKVPRI